MLKFSALKIRGLLLLSILPFIIIPLIGVSVYFISQWAERITLDVRESRFTDIEQETGEFEDYLRVPIQDLEYFRNAPIVVNFARALITNSPAEIDRTRTELETGFLALSNVRQIYYEVRFIDATGLERVRINYDSVAEQGVLETNLQNKADRPYFIETISKADGEIYISRIDLTREGTPPTLFLDANGNPIPVIRYATPIYVDGVLAGIIILNPFANPLFEIASPDEGEGLNYLLTSDGYYLTNSTNPELTFGFEPDVDLIGNQVGASFFQDANFNQDQINTILSAEEEKYEE
ncbi:MAG: hypothetical protein MUE54_10200 [Anaerolineae bacterium]|nr:hypothetical protein [Anaerolineae bacterium]